MTRYVIRDGELIERHLAPRQPVARSGLPSPYIRSDGMDPLLNHANGLMYDSKSAFERGVRDAGCEIMGNDRPAPRTDWITPGGEEQSIKDAIEELGGS